MKLKDELPKKVLQGRRIVIVSDGTVAGTKVFDDSNMKESLRVTRIQLDVNAGDGTVDAVITVKGVRILYKGEAKVASI